MKDCPLNFLSHHRARIARVSEVLNPRVLGARKNSSCNRDLGYGGARIKRPFPIHERCYSNLRFFIVNIKTNECSSCIPPNVDKRSRHLSTCWNVGIIIFDNIFSHMQTYNSFNQDESDVARYQAAITYNGGRTGKCRSSI